LKNKGFPEKSEHTLWVPDTYLMGASNYKIGVWHP